jgi:hypothetical protein
VSCPIYLSPATTRTKPFRLHQVWQPAPVDVGKDDFADLGGGQQGSAPSVTRLRADNASADGDESPAATRITVRPGAKNGKKEANQKGTRSTSASIALALNRGTQKKSTALVRPGCH